MQSRLLSHGGNEMLIEFNIAHNNEVKFISLKSKTYLCGAVAFQIQTDSARCVKYGGNNSDGNIIISARFVKLLKDDTLTYICKIKSTEFEKQDITFTQDDMWQRIHHQVKPDIGANGSIAYTFTLKVECDIAPAVAPFKSMYDDQELVDFELKGEGGNVAVHRQILAASSPVLKKLLSGNWKEATDGSVNVPRVTKGTLDDFKKYIYLNELPDSNIEQLLVLGSYYMMPDLVQKCVVKLLNGLSTENAIDLIEFSCKYTVPNLLTIILQNIQSGFVSLNFKQLE